MFRIPASIGLAMALSFGGAVWAEGDCESTLSKAEQSYLAGQFDDVLVTLEPCFDRWAPKAARADAYALAAKTYLADDDLDQARRAIRSLLLLEPDHQPGFRDPVMFARLVKEERGQGAVITVASVSKTNEPLREAPATVVVVTAEEIERRGYLDLEQVLHDLPGFDISRGNGNVYSNFYQRGFRSNANERTLFLVDGVEQNHLMSNTAYISRQYPLSNIDRIEVIYGPASTMYGANAYTGVISVLTKSPDALIEEGKAFGISAQTALGEFGTRWVDVSLAGRAERWSWSLTSRLFQSDEPDLSGFEDWDYDPGFADTFDYNRTFGISSNDSLFGFSLQDYVDSEDFGCQDLPALCRVILGPTGDVTGIELTEAGRQRVAAHDRALIQSGGFADPTDDWSVFGKLQVGRFNLGLQAWGVEEGSAPWFTDRSRDGSGSSWSPRQLAIYANYAQALNDSWSLSFSSRYKRHDLGSHSISTRYDLLANREGVNFENLLTLVGDGSMLTGFDVDHPTINRTRVEEASSQLRNELTLVYQPSQKLSVVGGFEFRNSSIQSGLIATDPDVDDVGVIVGANNDSIQTGDKIEQLDLGLFVQASLRVHENFKVILGGRLDYNRVENLVRGFSTEEGLIEVPGFGTVFNPRLAWVYTPGKFVLKAVYAEAFKEPSAFERFDGSELRVPNLSLEPEKVENLELSGSWQPNEAWKVEVATFEARYNTVIGSTIRIEMDPCCLSLSTRERFNNLGPLKIRGVQAVASWQSGPFQLDGNYTYTEPRNLDPVDAFGEPLPNVDELRVGDIAEHRLNLRLGFEHRRFHAQLAVNHVGSRRTGEGTTVAANPFQSIDAYTTANAALTYRNLFGGLDAQLVVHNLLDELYFHPGVQTADGVNFAARLPQPGRAVFLRFNYKR